MNDGQSNHGFLWILQNKQKYRSVFAASSDYSGASNHPKLVVTYSSMKKYFCLKDHLVNISVTVNDQGALVTKDDYYPFGLQMPELSYNNGNTNDYLKYSSKELDKEHGLDWYYFGARYYDPAIGRWLSVDSLSHLRPNLTPYHYVQNNPLNRLDADGNFDFWVMVNTGLAVMQSKVNSAMNTQVSIRVGSAGFNGSGREFLQMTNKAAGSAIMENLPSEEQVVNFLDDVSQAADDANMIAGPTAVATGAIPGVGEVTSGVSFGLSVVSVAADATKAVVTGNTKDYIKAGTNLAINGICTMCSNAVVSLTKDAEKKLLKPIMNGISNTLSTGANKAAHETLEKDEFEQ